MMVLPAHHQPHPGKEGLRPICAGSTLTVSHLVVDTLYVIQAMKCVPVARLVRVNLSSAADALFDYFNTLMLVSTDGC